MRNNSFVLKKFIEFMWKKYNTSICFFSKEISDKNILGEYISYSEEKREKRKVVFINLENIDDEITKLFVLFHEIGHFLLEKSNFIQKEEYIINDTYLINDTIDIFNMNTLNILKKCVLVRNVEGIEKELLYKYKEYADNGDITKQTKVKCPVVDISKAIDLMKAIGYRKLFNIYDKCIVFINNKTELVVQLVNNKYIFIEMESKCEYIDKEYNTIDDMKDDLCSYNLSIDKSNFFVKKAEIILKELLNNK